MNTESVRVHRKIRYNKCEMSLIRGRTLKLVSGEVSVAFIMSYRVLTFLLNLLRLPEATFEVFLSAKNHLNFG